MQPASRPSFTVRDGCTVGCRNRATWAGYGFSQDSGRRMTIRSLVRLTVGSLVALSGCETGTNHARRLRRD